MRSPIPSRSIWISLSPLRFVSFSPLRLVGRIGRPDEGRAHVLPQGHQVRAHALREVEIEVLRVVDRVEVPSRQEVEIAALGIEARRVVGVPAVGDLAHLPRRHVEESERDPAPSRREPVREPLAVRRPREPLDATEARRLDGLDDLLEQVDDDHLVRMGGDGDTPPGRVDDHLDGTADGMSS
jgi:hypothetical protein